MSNERVYYSHDAEIGAARDKTRLVVLCLMIGLGIGSALALLFAPTSGKAIRQDLAKSVEAGLQTGRETVEPLVKRLEEDLAEMRKNVEERLKSA